MAILYPLPSESCRKVTAADNYIIQEMVEVTVDAHIEDFMDGRNNTAVLIEPSPQLGRKFTINHGSLHCECSIKKPVSVRLINRSINPISIKQDTVLGVASVCTEKPIPQFQPESADQNRYFEKDEEDTKEILRDTIPASAEKDIIPLEEDLEIPCEKCENKSEHMSSRLLSHDAESTIRHIPDVILEQKSNPSFLKDHNSSYMTQISDKVQWLSRTNIAT